MVRCDIDMNALTNIGTCIRSLLKDRHSNGWPQLLMAPGQVETGEFAQIGVPSLAKPGRE
jgi:hypothetical protein